MWHVCEVSWGYRGKTREFNGFGLETMKRKILLAFAFLFLSPLSPSTLLLPAYTKHNKSSIKSKN